MELVPYVILTLASVLVLGRQVWEPHEIPRMSLMVVCALGSLLWQYMYGTSFFLRTDLTILLGIMLGWWLICNIVTQHAHKQLNDFTNHTAVVLFMFLAPFDLSDRGVYLGVGVVMIGVLANALYGFTQYVLRKDLLWKSCSNHTNGVNNAIGFLGNSNMLGNFLSAGFFLSVYMTANNWYWGFSTLFILVVIYMTKCRGSILGLIAGSWYLGIILTDFVIGTAIMFCLLMLTAGVTLWHKCLLYTTTLKERKNYWIVALEHIKRRPMFGSGFNGLRFRTPFLQAEINKRTNGKFLDPNNFEAPYMKRCHNDLLQMICDVGIIGAGIFVLLIIAALMAPVNIYIKAGLISLLASGLLLHNWSISGINILYWFFIMLSLKSYNSTTYINPVIMLCITVLMACLFLRFTLPTLVGKYKIVSFFIGAQTKPPDDILKYLPHDGTVLLYSAKWHQAKQNYTISGMRLMQGIINYDGEIRIWELWTNFGKVMWLLGNMKMAEAAYVNAINLWPASAEAKQCLDATRAVLTGQATMEFVPANKKDKINEPKINGVEHPAVRA
jgi:O-antigen ligase